MKNNVRKFLNFNVLNDVMFLSYVHSNNSILLWPDNSNSLISGIFITSEVKNLY
jgi:hypothetical protein